MNPLAQWDALKTAIDQAHSVIDLKAIRDQAEAYRYALKLAGEAPEYLRKAEIIKVRAERRAGELIQVMPKQHPGEYKRSEGATVQTLEEQGIDKRDASKWQRIASIPEKEFEEWIEKAPTVSTAGAIRVSREFAPPKEKTTSKPVPSHFSGKYKVLLADPVLSYEELVSLRLRHEDGERSVQDISEPNSLLFLWSNAEGLAESIKVMEAWGFTYETVAFTWVKRAQDGSPVAGKGDWTRGNAEYCLLGKLGHGLPRVGKDVSSILETADLVGGEKPGELRSRIIALVGDVPRIELFAKHRVRGWDAYSV